MNRAPWLAWMLSVTAFTLDHEPAFLRTYARRSYAYDYSHPMGRLG